MTATNDRRAANLDRLIAELADLAPEQQAQVRMFVRQLLSECDRSSSGRGSEAEHEQHRRDEKWNQ